MAGIVQNVFTIPTLGVIYLVAVILVIFQHFANISLGIIGFFSWIIVLIGAIAFVIVMIGHITH